jgi:hypothetical protein
MPPKTRPESGTKSAIVTVRLDPKLKYLAELAAKRQRRPLSSYIEWAVAQSLDDVKLDSIGVNAEGDPFRYEVSVSNAERDLGLWDPYEADRFMRLAIHFPELLDHDGQLLWKHIRENGAIWRGEFDENGEYTWRTNIETVRWDVLREHWDTFVDVAQGKSEHKKLPSWEKKGTPKKPSPPSSDFGGDFDDEVPF